MTVGVLFTAGYEGLRIDWFLALIGGHPIDMIVDVREHPLSRKPGFSKRALQEFLEQIGVDYVHIPELGSPTAMRRQLKESGEWDVFRTGYAAWLETQRAAFDTVRHLAKHHSVGLLCFEANVHGCHRSILGSKLLDRLEGYSWINLSRYGEKALR